jgi:hypothetical protein
VDELAEAQRRTEERLASVAVRVDELAARLTELAVRVDELAVRVDELAEAQRRTEEALQLVVVRVDGIDRTLVDMRDQLGHLEGRSLELQYARHAGGYFGHLLRRVRVVGQEELDDLLEAGVVAGSLNEASARDLRLADLIVRGRRPGAESETYVVVEVSAGIGRIDVERAARRAVLLDKLRPARAAVAGHRLTADAERLAAAAGVWTVLDGQVREAIETAVAQSETPE